MNEVSESVETDTGDRPKVRGGRPTKAAAIERDERLLSIAADMFMEHGFEGTSMERLAETAMIGKATLYARYADKGALFADVLRRKILLNYGSMESEFGAGQENASLEATLCSVGRRMIDLSLTPSSMALGRILAAQAVRFPQLATLAVEEGLSRQIRFIETILRRFSSQHSFALDDFPLLADLFISIVLGRISRLALLGVSVDPSTLDRRIHEAVKIFLKGSLVPSRDRFNPG
jgi:TetR/AcrR family transcriptional repressor of mexJK operon